MKVGETVIAKVCGKYIECRILEVRKPNKAGYGRVLLKTPKGSKVWRKTYLGAIV